MLYEKLEAFQYCTAGRHSRTKRITESDMTKTGRKLFIAKPVNGKRKKSLFLGISTIQSEDYGILSKHWEEVLLKQERKEQLL